MSIRIVDRESPSPIPKAKTIIINDQEVGEVTPSIQGDRLRWHSIIRLRGTRNIIVSTILVQGFGPSPRAAIADGVARSRGERDAMVEQLAWLEKELGTEGKTEPELETCDL